MALKVTAYVPCYNAEKYLADTLRALFTQTHPIDEVIVIDDGSTDATANVARTFPVQLIQHDTNRGLAAARNTAIRHSKNEFIASVDADVVASPTWLEQLLQLFAEPNIAGVGGTCIEYVQETAADRWRKLHLVQDLGDRDIVITPALSQGLSGFATVFRKSALQQVGGYNELYRTNWEDWDISVKLRAAGYTLVYFTDAVAYHMRRDTPYSVVRTAWRWVFWIRYSEGCYNKVVLKLLHNLRKAWSKSRQHLLLGDLRLLGIDCLYFMYFCWRDVQYFWSVRQARVRPRSDGATIREYGSARKEESVRDSSKVVSKRG